MLCMSKLVLVCTQAEAGVNWVDQSASVKMWVKLSHWLIQSLLASGLCKQVQATVLKQMTYIYAHNFLIFNWFSIWLKFWKAEIWGFPSIPSIAMSVKGVEGLEASHKNFWCIQWSYFELLSTPFWHTKALQPLQCILRVFWYLWYKQ